MRQVFPRHRHLVKCLWVFLASQNEEMWYRERAFLTFCESPSGYILTCLIWTFEPPRVPSYRHPETDGRLMSRKESGRVHDFGSSSLAPHISPSSCRDSWNAGLVWSEIPMRTYPGGRCGMRRDDLETHYPGTRRATPNIPFVGLG